MSFLSCHDASLDTRVIINLLSETMMISQLKFHICLLCVVIQCISFSNSLRITPSLSSIRIRTLNPSFATSDIADTSSSQQSRFAPEGTHYCQCGYCKSAYILPKTMIEKEKGSRVKCSVCQKEWYQSFEKLATTSKAVYLTDLQEEKIKEVKRIISDTNVPKYPRIDRHEIFVGSIPFSYSDANLAELFAEYGIVNSYIVKDQQQNSRGFGFVEVGVFEPILVALVDVSGFLSFFLFLSSS